MPELPEVETSVKAIQEFVNQSLESINIYNPNLRWKVDIAAFKKLKGLKVNKINRRAKYILIHIEQSQVLIGGSDKYVPLCRTCYLEYNNLCSIKVNDLFKNSF